MQTLKTPFWPNRAVTKTGLATGELAREFTLLNLSSTARVGNDMCLVRAPV